MRSLLIATLLLAVPVPARAEIFATPFMGLKFGGSTSIVDLEFVEGAKKFSLGGSIMQIGEGLIGFEGMFGYVPDYFDGDTEFVKAGSFAIDLTGSVIIAAPQGITGGGLRPYAAVGAGIIHAQSQEFLNVFQVRRTVPAGIVGGGVYGLITNNVGVRFDYRYLRSLTTDDGSLANINRRISYSRFYVGLLLRL